MDKKKKIIIFILIIVLICLVLIFVIDKLQKKEKKEELRVEEEGPVATAVVNIEEITDESEVFMIQNCIEEYYKAIKYQEKDVVINLLDKNYIKNNDITIENVLNKLDNLESGFEGFRVKKLNKKEVTLGNDYEYYVYGEFIEKEYKSVYPVYIVLKLDYEHYTFSIIPQQPAKIDEEMYFEKIEEEKRKLTGEEKVISEQVSQPIKKNENNDFFSNQVEEKQILGFYVEDFIETAVYTPEVAYDLLDQEYKENRFKDLDDFKKYIKNKESEMLNYAITEYSVEEKEGYRQFIIKDTENNYYIFKVTDLMKYTVVLDYYTVDIEEIVKKYDEGNERVKCDINIQKVAAAIRDKNYEYIYSKLAEGFKENYYKTYEEFEKYMTEKFVGNLDVQMGRFRNEGNTFIYDILFQGSRASSNKKIEMQVIMQLKDDRDYIMSFNIK